MCHRRAMGGNWVCPGGGSGRVTERGRAGTTLQEKQRGGREGKKRHQPHRGWRGSSIPLRDGLRGAAAGKRGAGFDDPGGASLPWEGGWLRKSRVVM